MILCLQIHPDLKTCQILRVDPRTGEFKNDSHPLMILRIEMDIAMFLLFRIQHESVCGASFPGHFDFDIEQDPAKFFQKGLANFRWKDILSLKL